MEGTFASCKFNLTNRLGWHVTEVVSFPFVEGGSLNFGILEFQVQLEHGLTN